MNTPSLDNLVEIFTDSDPDNVWDEGDYDRNARALHLELNTADYSAIDVPQLIAAYAALSPDSGSALRQATVITLRALRGSSFTLSDTLVLLDAYARSYGDAFVDDGVEDHASAVSHTLHALPSELNASYGISDAVALIEAYGQNADGDADAYDVTDLRRATCMTLDVLQRTQYRARDAVALIELYNRFSPSNQDIDDLADAAHHTLSALHSGEFHIDDALGLIRAYGASTRDGTNEPVEESAASLRAAVCKTLTYVRTHQLDLQRVVEAIETAPEHLKSRQIAAYGEVAVSHQEPPQGLLTRWFGIGARAPEPTGPVYTPITTAAVCEYVLNLSKDSLQASR